MKRTPLVRRTPLRRGGPLRRRRPARRVDHSQSMAPWCELGPVIRTVDPTWPCTRWREGIHELRKRSAGGSLTNVANLRSACNRCNGWVEDHPADAHRLGLVVRAGDPLFHSLADHGRTTTDGDPV